MSKYSDYIENIGIDWFLGNAVPASPGQLKVHTFNGDPTDDGANGTDVSTQINGVGGVNITFTQTLADPVTYGQLADVSFGDSQNNVTVDHVAIKDAAGNFIYHDDVPSKTIQTGNAVSFPVGSLTFTLQGWLSAALRELWAEYVFEGQALAAIGGPYYAAPFNGDPENGGTEVTGNTTNNGRIQLTFARDSNNQASNTNEADYGKFTANTDVDYWALFDAAIAGNLIHKWSVPLQSGVSGEDGLVIKVGSYVVKFD